MDTAGIITTVAGNGTGGSGGDGGPATSAALNDPYGVAVQESGILYIAELGGNAVRRVDAAGTIDTLAGAGSPGLSGGGFAPFALLDVPTAVTVDRRGTLYVADSSNNRIRSVSTSYLWVSATPDPTKVGDTFTYDLTLSGLPATASGVSPATRGRGTRRGVGGVLTGVHDHRR